MEKRGFKQKMLTGGWFIAAIPPSKSESYIIAILWVRGDKQAHHISVRAKLTETLSLRYRHAAFTAQLHQGGQEKEPEWTNPSDADTVLRWQSTCPRLEFARPIP